MTPRRTKSEIAAGFQFPLPDDKFCGGCRRWLPLDQFAKAARASDGRQSRCAECHRLAMREWRARKRDSERQTERYRTDPEQARRVRARQRVNQQVQRGTLQRQSCERCGVPNAQTHHPDYQKPTEIRWLCPKCHGAEHYPKAQPEHRQMISDGLSRLAEKYANR